MRMLILAAAAAVGLSTQGWAQAYPDKPVTIISPYAAGGSGDAAARFIADALAKRWGQAVTVENITGGGSMIGSAHVAQATPDGYTLLVHGTSMTMVPAVRDDLPFDPAKDLAPVSMISATQFVLVAGPSVKAETLQEFIAEAKERPMFAATSGPATSTHFAAELLASAAGIDMTMVPYKGGSEAVVDVAGGRADIYASTVASGGALLEAGKLKALGIMGSKRLASMPDVPSFAEQGVDADVLLWWGVFAPAGTPDDIVAKIAADIDTIMKGEEGKQYLDQQQAYYPEMTVPEFTDYVGNEQMKWKKVADERHITIE